MVVIAICVTAIVLAIILSSTLITKDERTPNVESRYLWEDLRVGQEVGLYLGDGQTVKGTVVKHDADSISIAGAALFGAGQTERMPGVLRVFAPQISAVQEVPEKAESVVERTRQYRHDQRALQAVED